MNPPHAEGPHARASFPTWAEPGGISMTDAEYAQLLAEIKRLDQLIAEREKQLIFAMEASERAILKTEQEGLRAREASNQWRGAMNDRERSFVRVESHDLLQAQVTRLELAQQQSVGRRAAWIAAAGIIATLIAIGVGQIISQGITASDVSNQIQREAPWNRDKAATERRISILEAQVQRDQVQIAKLQADVRAHFLITK